MQQQTLATEDLQPKEVIRALSSYANTNAMAVALWRSPNSTNSNLIIDTSGSAIIEEEDLEDLLGGFLFSPFSPKGDKRFINANISFCSADKHYHTTAGQLEVNESINDFLRGWSSNQSLAPFPKSAKTFSKDSCSRQDYLNYVEDCINQIKRGTFQKIVPARYKLAQLNPDIDLIAVFEDLAEKYPNAFVSLVAIPEVGTWIGATPELLLSTDENDLFVTSSLAGTQPLDIDKSLVEMPWTQKEIEEQAMVSRYIINCFKTIRLREFEEDGPKTVKAGNLVHLKTTFQVDMKATNFPNLGSVMLGLLHPTSAICGMPMAPAMEFIEDNEGFEREFYSGYLGPVNLGRQTQLYVNLRSMQVSEINAVIYAGAGVTSYSSPEKEWEETEMKCNTLLDILSQFSHNHQS